MSTNECLFCNIAGGTTPDVTIYENDTVFAFLDIKPVSAGHTLVIPKKHYENIYELPDALLSELGVAARDVAVAVKEGVGADGINITMNNGKSAGQVIYHAHIHVIPRKEGDGLRHWNGQGTTQEELKSIAEKIRRYLL